MKKIKQLLKDVKALPFSGTHIHAVDEYLKHEDDVFNRQYVLAIHHLPKAFFEQLLSSWCIYTTPSSYPTLKDLIMDREVGATFELNDETYTWAGNFQTKDPLENNIIVPMFKKLGGNELVELDLNKPVRRAF